MYQSLSYFNKKFLFQLTSCLNIFSSKYYCNLIKEFTELPGPKPSLPLIGTGWQYFKYGRYNLSKLHLANIDKFERYGKILKEEYEWKKPVVHLIQPKDFLIVFLNQGMYPIRPVNKFVCHYRMNNKSKYSSVGISNLNGKEWYQYRQKVLPVLYKLSIPDFYLPQLNEICEDFKNYIKIDGQKIKNNLFIINLQNITYKLALESICMLCLDSRMDCLTGNTIQKDGISLMKVTQKLFFSYNKLYYSPPIWKIIKTKSYQNFAKSENIIYQIIDKYVEKALTSQTNSFDVNKSHSILNTLLAIQDLDKKDVRTLIIDFISGGINTISNSLTFILLNLANNFQVQNKLYNEIKMTLKDENEPINSKHINQLKYLKACIKESFRLNSTIPCLVRELPKEIILNNYRIPSNTVIFSHFYATCHSSKYFDNPSQYLPERWLDSRKKNIHPFSLLPFGFGTKMCSGRRFSEILLYLATIKLVRNYELYPITKNVELKHSFILIPENPIKILFKKRNF